MRRSAPSCANTVACMSIQLPCASDNAHRRTQRHAACGRYCAAGTVPVGGCTAFARPTSLRAWEPGPTPATALKRQTIPHRTVHPSSVRRLLTTARCARARARGVLIARCDTKSSCCFALLSPILPAASRPFSLSVSQDSLRSHRTDCGAALAGSLETLSGIVGGHAKLR